jgi:glucose/arabinose dehydrogenase
VRLAPLVLAFFGLTCARDNAPTSTAANYETVVTGLYVPWSIAFAPDGRAFVTERPGRIRVLNDWKLDPQPWATLDIAAVGEAGLMGIAVSPDFQSNHHVFVVATFRMGERLVNRVIRFTERNGRGSEPTTIIADIPANEFHAGDAIAFGPDRMLYVATGDAGQPSNSADRTSLAGKILRLDANGQVPADNPFPNSPVYALGLRNVQGLAWSADGQLFANDHGPSGFPNERLRRNHDELNAIVRGGNHGWPKAAGFSDDARLVSPLLDWSPAIAPSGIAAYTGPHKPWHGSLFIGGLRGRQLRRIQIDRSAGSWRVRGEEVLFREELGRVRAVVMAPDGFIYFTTSNWDGRGEPGPQDDRILRLRPR